MVYVHRKLCMCILDAHNHKKSLAVKEIALKVYDTAKKTFSFNIYHTELTINVNLYQCYHSNSPKIFLFLRVHLCSYHTSI